jgi:hypothetical protein
MCVAMPVAGALTGVVQLGRGVTNTPRQLSAKSRGMQWDPAQSNWVFYSLPEEAAKLEAVDESKLLGGKELGGGARRKNRQADVADTAYYDALGARARASVRATRLFAQSTPPALPSVGPSLRPSASLFVSPSACLLMTICNPAMPRRPSCRAAEKRTMTIGIRSTRLTD